MKETSLIILFLAAMVCLQCFSSSGVLAQKESCEQCKYVDCLKGAIRQKEAMSNAYSELAQKWEKIWVNTDSGSPVPLDQINLTQLKPTSRASTLGILTLEFQTLRKDEADLAARIGAPSGCGYNPNENLEMETDSIRCTIDMLKARKAEDASPCKELYEIAFRHETTHLQNCQTRKGNNKTLPIIVLTPAGKAREEAAAYAQEVAQLKEILKRLEKKCTRTATATTDNGITYTAVRCDPSPWGEWKLTVTGAMAGNGSITLDEKTSGGSWSVTTTLPGMPVAIRQTGKVDYVEDNPAILRLTTDMASAHGVTEAPQKSINLQVSFGGQSCP